MFGAYTHTFVEADFTFRGDPVSDGEKMRAIDHFALAVPFGEIENWTDFYVLGSS